MSATPVTPPDLVNVEIDGRKVKVAKGSMIIQASDAAGIGVPRFCYHKKLPIAANCRMCLVDVEKMPKPAPACATPVMEGMVVRTQTARALSAQRNVMEFLLVNHPLDCPICDQGGECELQDVAMGYGRSVSRFAERKRSVADEDLGPLVATDMTRCIHCTRCVRFMDDIAGTQELGGMSRGEHLEIGTFTGKPLASELSGNVIDVCPVGALTNKVFRFRARPWELIARESIALHDSLHSNLWLHTRRGEVLRTVPRDNEAINECWLADRDRYSHQAWYHPERLHKARVKHDGQWREVELAEAVVVVAAGLRKAGAAVGGLLAGMSSNEDAYSLKALLGAFGSSSHEYRLRSSDLSGANPGLGAPLAEFENARAVLLVGSNPRLDQPLLGHRIRKAWKRGAAISAINPLEFEFNFELKQALSGDALALPALLLQVCNAVVTFKSAAIPAQLREALAPHAAGELAQAVARDLCEQSPSRVVLGDLAVRHPQASLLRAAARLIGAVSGAVVDEFGDGSNAVGLAQQGLGCVGGVDQVLEQRALLLQGVEPADLADVEGFRAALKRADFVVALTAFAAPELLESAHVLLPLALPGEAEGSFVNIEGIVQGVGAGAKAPGDARAGWRLLKAIADAAQLQVLDVLDFAGMRNAAANARQPVTADAPQSLSTAPGRAASGLCLTQVLAPYAADPVLRRAQALSGTTVAEQSTGLVLNPEDARALGLDAGALAELGKERLTVQLSARVPAGSCVAYAGHGKALPATGSMVQLRRVEQP